jgi:two-component system response regulator HupR/HoxA
LLLTLKRAAELYRLQRENCQLAVELRAALPVLRGRVEATRRRVRRAFALDQIVRTPGSPMGAVCDLVERAARFDVAVLLCGESGTGKELLARAIHYASPRAERAFVVENCGALPDNLLESELFGHKRGSFTGAYEYRIGLFQQADGGTLFLDEIGETSPAFQVKLLRVLQEGECRPLGGRGPIGVDVRLITATNRDLEAEVKAGRFREDLYYRLATVPLRLPPLRERPQDIPALAEAVLAKAAAALGRPVEGLAKATLDCLTAYPWPGNVRELQNELQRMLVLSDGPILTPDLLAPQIRQAGIAATLGVGTLTGLRGRVDALEGQLLAETLARHDGNISRAARELGLSRLGLRNKMQRLGLERPGKAG